MVGAVGRHKAGFRHSDLNIKPSATLGDVRTPVNATAAPSVRPGRPTV
jgi:hypothetical protein